MAQATPLASMRLIFHQLAFLAYALPSALVKAFGIDSQNALQHVRTRHHMISTPKANPMKALSLSLLSLPATRGGQGASFHQAVRHLDRRPASYRTQSRLTGAHMQAQAPRLGASLKTLLASNRAAVDALASIAPDMSEVALLRFALAFPNRADAQRAIRERLAWEKGAGKRIVDSASGAVAKATASGGWDNSPVAEAAPNAAAVGRYITPRSVLTLSTDNGDLIYVIRASAIDDKTLMSRVSTRELSDFLLYAKEVHSLVADSRSTATGRLCRVIFANDITGIVQPPDSRFQNALTGSSQEYEKLYPCLAGPTMILNLPFFLQIFVNLFKPLFPQSLQDRLLFENAPFLAGLRDLSPLTSDRRSRQLFLDEIRKLTRNS